MEDVKIKELAQVLTLESKIYQAIYKLGEEKKEVIIAEEIDQLELIVKKEEEYLAKVEKLEEKRKDLVGEKSISQIIEGIELPYRNNLQEIRKELTQVISELNNLNQLNNQLLEDALQLANFNVNLLTDNRQGTYSKQGATAKNQNHSSIINHKA